jgi:hypothetical protein
MPNSAATAAAPRIVDSRIRHLGDRIGVAGFLSRAVWLVRGVSRVVDAGHRGSSELRPADGSLIVIVSVLIASLLLAIVVVRRSHASPRDRFAASIGTPSPKADAWRRSEIHRHAVIVKKHLALTPEVLLRMGGPPLTLQMNAPTRRKPVRASAAACVLGWIAWVVCVSGLLAVVLIKAVTF